MATDDTSVSHTDTVDAPVDQDSGNLLDTSTDVSTETSADASAEQGEAPFELPEEYHDNPRFEGIDSQEALLQRIAQAAAPETYAFPEGYPEELSARLSEQAKAMDISQDQLDGFLKLQADEDKAFSDQLSAEIDKGVESLKSEWGDEFEANVKSANRAILAFDGDGALRGLMKENPVIANHPTVVKYFLAIQKAIDVDRYLDSEGQPKQRPTDEHGRPYLGTYDKTMK